MKHNALPVIFLLDMDATMIGASDNLEMVINLVTFMKNTCLAKKTMMDKCPRIPTYTELAPPEFFRPGLKEMLKGIESLYENAEVFVYSAGTKDYVHQMVNAIEKNTGFHFNRPLFTRDECIVTENNNWGKSVLVNSDAILKPLTKKYPYLKKVPAQYILDNRVIFVDDYDFVWDIKSKWVQCPGYKYSPAIDYLSYVDKDLLTNQAIKDYLKTMFGYEEPEKATTDERNVARYMFALNLHYKVMDSNKAALKDTFCKQFLAAIKPFRKLEKPFCDKNIEKIRAAVKPASQAQTSRD